MRTPAEIADPHENCRPDAACGQYGDAPCLAYPDSVYAGYDRLRGELAQARAQYDDFLYEAMEKAREAAGVYEGTVARLEEAERALKDIRVTLHEPSLSEFSRLVAIGVRLSALDPLTPEEIEAGKRVARVMAQQEET